MAAAVLEALLLRQPRPPSRDQSRPFGGGGGTQEREGFWVSSLLSFWPSEVPPPSPRPLSPVAALAPPLAQPRLRAQLVTKLLNPERKLSRSTIRLSPPWISHPPPPPHCIAVIDDFCALPAHRSAAKRGVPRQERPLRCSLRARGASLLSWRRAWHVQADCRRSSEAANWFAGMRASLNLVILS